jgi:hypothetical protein
MSNLLEEIEEGFELGVADLEQASRRLVELYKADKHCRRHHRDPERPHIIFTIRYETLTIQGDLIEMNMQVGQEVLLDAAVDGAFEKGSGVWTSSDPTVVAVAVNPANELEAQASSVAPGTATVTLTLDPDPNNANAATISGSIDITIDAKDATEITITAGTPTPIPGATPANPATPATNPVTGLPSNF